MVTAELEKSILKDLIDRRKAERLMEDSKCHLDGLLIKNLRELMDANAITLNLSVRFLRSIGATRRGLEDMVDSELK